MSELTDHLGLTGEQRESVEQAWASWKLLLGLKRPAMETFRRVLLEHSTAVERGAPPGFAWNRGGLQGSPQAAPLFASRQWAEPFVVPIDEARHAWMQARPIGSPEILNDNMGFCRRSRKNGSVWTRVHIPVTWKQTFDTGRGAALMEWKTFWAHLGIHGGTAEILTDFMFENSSKLVDDIYPPLLQPGKEIQQALIRGAMNLTGDDPGLIFVFPRATFEGEGGRVCAWRRIDL